MNRQFLKYESILEWLAKHNTTIFLYGEHGDEDIYIVKSIEDFHKLCRKLLEEIIEEDSLFFHYSKIPKKDFEQALKDNQLKSMYKTLYKAATYDEYLMITVTLPSNL